MNTKNLNQILFLLTYFVTQHDVINAMKRPHAQISNSKKNEPLPALKKIKLNNNTAAFLCALCNKSFSRNDNLTIHQRTHTGEKPYPCDMCDKNFAHKSNLTTHQRIHTRKKPYKCDVCDKNFSQKSNLTIHQRTHTKEKLYSCDICHNNFTANRNLIIHQRTHTKTITPTVNLVENNTEPMLAQTTTDISLNTPTDYQDILGDIPSINDANFIKWIKQ